MSRTYSTAELAVELAGDSMVDPERWLLRQIKNGRIAAMKIGRHWRLDEEQKAAAKLQFSNRVKLVPAQSEPEVVVPIGRPSAGSLKRRVS